MSKTTEQLLKDLEHSTANPPDLLNQATSIAGIQFDSSFQGYTKVSQSQSSASSDFREQWLLKWALKKLNETVRTSKQQKHADNPLNELVYHSNFWSLVSYLLPAVLAHNAIEICLERNFSSLLTHISTSILSDYKSKTKGLEIDSSNDTGSERPRKRIRLSPAPASVSSAAVEDRNGVPTADITLQQFVKVLKGFARLLQSRQHSSSTSARSVIPAWTTSIKEAAAFVGSVLTCVQSVLSSVTCHEIHEREAAANAAVLWLQLWQKFSNSNAAMEKILITKAFNEACLGSCLTLCNLISRATESYMVSLRKELEKQVALYTVLPLRSSFEAKLAATWKQDQKTLSWLNIEPVTKMISDHLGTTLQTQTIASYQYILLPDPKWASCIISIAARLIPKDDIRRRQRESPWLGALTLSLAHLTFPREMPRLHEDPDGFLYPGAEVVPPSSDSLLGWPDEILDVLVEDEIRLSMSTKIYLAMSLLYWRNRPLSVVLLAKIVDIDPDLFVPTINKQKSPSLINDLINSLNENKTLNGSQYGHTIKTIIYPIMEAFAEARDLDGLINTWLPNLEDAFRVRTSASFSTDSAKGDIPVALVWDDEDVFSWFTELCQLHAPANFGRILLTETLNGLKNISERIGSTIDLFAKVAVLQCVLQANARPSETSSDIEQDFSDLAKTIAEVVQHQNDYQGQRWRLWSVMTTLCTLGTMFDNTESLVDAIKQRCKRFHSMSVSDTDAMQQGQRSALLMEQYSIFAWLFMQCKYTAEQDDSRSSGMTELLQKEIDYLVKHIRKQDQSHTKDLGSQVFHKDGHLWDGQLNNLLSTRQLVDGQIACILTADPDVNMNTLHSLLSSLQEALPTSESASIQSPAQATFSKAATIYLSGLQPTGGNYEQLEMTDSHGIEIESSRQSKRLIQHENTIMKSMDEMAFDAQKHLTEPDTLQKNNVREDFDQTFQKPSQPASAILAGATVLRIDTAGLQSTPSVAKSLVSMISLRGKHVGATVPEVVLRLELCMLVLKLQPSIVNQSSIDTLLADVATYASSAISIGPSSRSQTDNGSEDGAEAIFDRLLAIVGILLTRYRRRLSGRTHLLLPTLQNLLKCFFYSPSKKYMYQNTTTAKQKQTFRSSLPSWLGNDALPAPSATKFSRLISSICNPTAASARSAHRTQRKKGSTSLELSDETRKAKRIAAQYMQYLIMEYARCNLDGVIKPEVREKLMPGLYSILDAMDRDLMKAMNSAMDPSSRAIFKGLYDDWNQHWRWDQT